MTATLRKLLIALSLIMGIALAGLISACSLVTQSSIRPQHTRTTVPDVSTELLSEHVRQLSVTYHPRSYQHPDNLNAAADYIKQHLSRYSEQVADQPFQVEGQTYRNIIARFGPQQGERLVIGAHYDSYGMTRGADDNASGVAGLLELARLFHANPPQMPVELVAYSLEEPPFFRTDNMGSAVHARELARSGEPVKLMISLEMIGFFSDEADSQSFPYAFMQKLYSDRGDFIAVVSNLENRKQTGEMKALMQGATDLPVHSLNTPSFVTGIDFSDHRNYWKEGFPAVMVTNTAFFRNPHYHESGGDRWDDLDYTRMAKVVQGVYVAALNL